MKNNAVNNILHGSSIINKTFEIVKAMSTYVSEMLNKVMRAFWLLAMITSGTEAVAESN